MKQVIAIAVAGLVAFASPASACRWVGNHRALIHSAVTIALPAKAIVLDVEFDGENPDAMYRGGLRARVNRVVAGSYEGDFVLIKRPAASSCDHPFDNGSSGLIVGFLTKDESFFPVLVQHQSGFQLRADDLVLAP
ncbi:MAG: hypothetical protein Q7T61_13490 [Caulobacter sp.]|nr:hypothetical protein [Caulobacter sp.]